MAEEPDAGGQPGDDEPADGADETGPEDDGGKPVDGAPGADGPADGADAGDDGVGPEVEPEVESAVDEAAGGAGPGSDGESDTEDRPEPVGAVTDATSPPDASAPGVDDSEGTEEDLNAGADARAAGDRDDAETDPQGAPDAPAADIDPDGGEAADVMDPDHPTTIDDVETEAPIGTEPEPEDDPMGPEPEPEDDPIASAAASAGPPGTGAEVDEPARPAPEGPPDDEEMPLADHVEEMVLRLSVVCAVAAVVAGAVFFFEPLAEETIMFIWNSVLPDPEAFEEVATDPRVYGPLELKLAELKFASLVGFVVALPVFVYETYRFMRPGLYPHERRYYLAAVPTSLVLAVVGVSFAYFIVLPAIFAYFVRYSERAGQLAFALQQTFDLIVVLMGYMALVFQIPLLIMLAIMIGVTDRQWLEGKRLYFWGGFLGVSFLFIPEPTGMAPILVALTMIGLFEGTLALLRWTGN